MILATVSNEPVVNTRTATKLDDANAIDPDV